MSSTAYDITITEPTAPAQEPSPQVRSVDPDTVEQLAVGQGDTREGREYVSRSSRPAGRPVRRAVVVEVDEDGCFIVSDLLGAVYGAGPSEEEAERDFYRALDEHLAYLRGHLDEIHPRLERQLAGLQRLFPDR